MRHILFAKFVVHGRHEEPVKARWWIAHVLCVVSAGGGILGSLAVLAWIDSHTESNGDWWIRP
jgi:hypothetical protein